MPWAFGLKFSSELKSDISPFIKALAKSREEIRARKLISEMKKEIESTGDASGVMDLYERNKDRILEEDEIDDSVAYDLENFFPNKEDEEKKDHLSLRASRRLSGKRFFPRKLHYSWR